MKRWQVKLEHPTQPAAEFWFTDEEDRDAFIELNQGLIAEMPASEQPQIRLNTWTLTQTVVV